MLFRSVVLIVTDVGAVVAQTVPDLAARWDRELQLFDPALGNKPQIVAANKLDVPEAVPRAEALAVELKKRGVRVHLISGVTGLGVPELLDAVVAELDRAGSPPPLERDEATPA